jgi:hypothetical protein
MATDSRHRSRERPDLDHAYKVMAWLGERGEAIEGEDSGQTRHRTDAIEEALYKHRKSLFGAISVAFFDTTSLYFEGDCEAASRFQPAKPGGIRGRGGATLGHTGHSREFRPRLEQVVLGIGLDEQDCLPARGQTMARGQPTLARRMTEPEIPPYSRQIWSSKNDGIHKTAGLSANL